jgi:DNA (cytosine-5)-methyltransferase 1
MTRLRFTNRRGVLDLFAGAGGFTWGWHRAGLTPLAAVEVDVAATRTYELNFRSDRTLVLNRDLEVFGPRDLASVLGKCPTDLLVIAGGPPCQGWSKVGRGKLRSLNDRSHSLLNDPRNRLYKQFIGYVEYFRPPVVVMENVPGMLNLEGRNVADEVVTTYLEIGYKTRYAVVNARWFGVPQDRKRLIFIATRNDLRLDIDAAGLEEFGPQFRASAVGLSAETTLREAIADLPVVPHGTQEDPQPYHRPEDLSAYAKLMREHSGAVITDHICREHNSQDLEAFSLMMEGGQYHELPDHLKRYRDDIFKDKYKRLIWDRPAWTVTAHFAKDCYTHIHPAQPRTVSIREAARIQSFPDSFRFFGNMGDRFRQIGNAVPPLMAWGIAEFIKSHLVTDRRHILFQSCSNVVRPAARPPN